VPEDDVEVSEELSRVVGAGEESFMSDEKNEVGEGDGFWYGKAELAFGIECVVAKYVCRWEIFWNEAPDATEGLLFGGGVMAYQVDDGLDEGGIALPQDGQVYLVSRGTQDFLI